MAVIVEQQTICQKYALDRDEVFDVNTIAKSTYVTGTMCDFHDFVLTWKCQKMCCGWLQDYLKD